MAPPPPRPKHPNLPTYHLTLTVVCILLLAFASTTSTTAVSTTYSSACPSLAPAADRHTDADDAQSLASSFYVYNGHFAGSSRENSLFSFDDDQLHNSYHMFGLFPDRAARTSDTAVVHLNARLQFIGPRGRRRGRNHTTYGFVSFDLDGYYSFASLELCMVGTSTTTTGTMEVVSADVVVLRLRVPKPSTLADPFVTGTLEGSSDVGAIQLLAYTRGDDYEYSDTGHAATCSPPAAPPLGFGGDLPACGHLIDQLSTLYTLVAPDHHHGGGAPARLPRRMYVNQMHCTGDGAVRAYVVFTNDTERRASDGFMVVEEAAVAEGRWDRARGMLCLRACRVVRSVPPSILAVRECGIGMSFWFQAVWTVRDRNVAAGMLWNTSAGAGNDSGGPISGVNLVSAFSVDDPDGHHRRNLSDVRYEYKDTMLQEAKKHYLTIINIPEKKMRGSFPVPARNYDTYYDFSLHFSVVNSSWNGKAYPVSIGSAMMTEDALAAADDDSFSRHAVAGALLSVSYDIHLLPVPPRNVSSSHSPRLEQEQIKAEGVYDPKRGILCMVGCREQAGSTPDCRVLVTVQFASLDSATTELGHCSSGAISSLRDRADRLFFEKMEIYLYGMYSGQVYEAVSRMDLESVMLVASATLSCVFAAAQILHTKRNPEAAAATSVTMLAVLALGYLAPLALSFEVMFASRRSRYGLSAYSAHTNGWLELNQVMVNVPALIAFVLHMRLLQLAFSGRRRSVSDQSSKPIVTTSERTVLKICLPLYLLGAVVAATVHAIMIRAASEMGLRVVRVGDLPATLLEDLVSYTGLILDGFLLPQVILNASGGCSGAVVRAISPWFYLGGTVVRVMPHVYDLVRRQVYEQSMSPSEVYASRRGDLFGVAWDIVVPCGAALLALALFRQQRLRGVGGAV